MPSKIEETISPNSPAVRGQDGVTSSSKGELEGMCLLSPLLAGEEDRVGHVL